MLLKKEFYFLRHGETDFNANKVLPGADIDISLNQNGQEQAKNIRPLLKKLSFKTICHSPMKRVKETMEIAFDGYDLTKIVVEELRECSYETWMEMTSLADNRQITAGISEFYHNALKGINKALKHPGPVFIIAHGGIHWALCSQLNIINHPKMIDNCHLVNFIPEKNGWKTKLILS